MPSFGRPISIFRCRWTPRPRGLKGVANWFYVQFQEEQDHARIFMNYILSRDAEVKLLPIEEVRTAWTSPLEMFQDTLAMRRRLRP